ncbi:MAG: hypothetical protein Q7O66_13550 [Dehalococcoidia bacterium]|nr:hypothetical protein [Dehalococcoidia bacterium]
MSQAIHFATGKTKEEVKKQMAKQARHYKSLGLYEEAREEPHWEEKQQKFVAGMCFHK